MKFLELHYLCILSLVERLAASNIGDGTTCTINSAAGDDPYRITLPLNGTIYDNVDTQIFNEKSTGKIADLKCDTGDNYNGFFNVQIDPSQNITISPNVDKMKNFDKITPKNSYNFERVSISCTFKCYETQKKLSVEIQVNDYNEHEPTFDKNQYEFKVPIPLTNGFQTNFEGGIVVEDIDFSNQNVDFTIVPNDFEIISQPMKDDPKKYIPTFSAKGLIQFSEKKTYTLEVTDQGDYPKRLSSTATLTLKIDDNQSPDNPSFEAPSYNFDYKIQNEIPVLIPIKGNIILKTRKPQLVLADSIRIDGELKQYLTAKFDAGTKIISLDSKPIPAGSKTLFSTLAVATDGVREALTAIVVHMPEITFSSNSYTVTYYAYNDTVVADTAIKVNSSSGDTPVVTLGGNNAKYFDILPNVGTDTYEVKPSKEMDKKVVSKNTYISLQILAESDGVKASAALIVNLPSKADKIAFTSSIYKATYSIDPLAVKVVDPIQFKASVGNISIIINKDYDKYFKADYVSNQVTLSTKSILEENVLQKESAVLLTLKAEESETAEETTCTVNVELPIETKAPIYGNTFYTVVYPKDATVNSVIKFNPAISFSNVADQSKLVLGIQDFNDSFSAMYTGSEWVLKIVKLMTKLPLRTNLIAKRKIGNSMETKIALNIDGENDAQLAPKFTKAYYEIDYEVKGTNHTVSSVYIELSNVKDPANVVISAEQYKDNFMFKLDGTQKWKITLKSQLSDDILKDQKPLLDKLTVSEKGNSNVDTAILVVHLPITEDETPVFSSPLYQAKYSISGGKPSLAMLDGNVIKIPKNGDGAVVSLSCAELNNIMDYFTITTDYVIGTKKLLPDETLQKTTLSITLTAVKGVYKGYAALVIYMPEKSQDKNIVFSNVLYHGKYDAIDSKLNLDQITVNTKEADDNVECCDLDSAFKSWFIVSYKNKQVTISLTNPIPKEKLKDVSNIAVKVTIGVKGSAGKSSAVLNIDVDNNMLETVFSNVLYHGQYDAKDGKLNLEQITVNTNEADNNVECCDLDSTFKAWFIVSYKNKQVTVSLKEPIPRANLKDVSSIALRITIGDKGSTDKSSAVLNIDVHNLPNIEFSSVLYHGEYDAKDSKLKLDELSVLTTAADDSIDCCEIDSKFKSWFNVSYKNKQVHLSLKDPISKEKLEDVSNIAIKVTIGVKESTDNSSAVLNIDVEGIDSDSPDSSSDNDTIYIVVICILALLIIALVTAAVVFYRRKRRNPAYTEIDEEKPQVKFEKGTKDSNTSSRKSSIINRRPTGFTFQPPPDEDNDNKELPSAPAEENEYTEPVGNPDDVFAENRNRKKSVVFDDHVEKLQIDSNDSNDDKSIASIEKQPDNLENGNKPTSINNTTVV